MPQFIIPKKAIQNQRVTLGGAEARHIRGALRYRIGDSIQLFDGEGQGYEGRILGMDARHVDIQVVRERPRQVLSSMRVALAPALVAGSAMDEVIRQATELGVSEITPIQCERSVVRLDASRAQSRRRHWEKVALAACKQCGRLDRPDIHALARLEDWLDRREPREKLWVGDPSPEARPLRECLKFLDPTQRLSLVIGPEGGLTAREIAAVTRKRGEKIKLGELILRSPTASVYVLSVLSCFSQDL